ncbi:hypothetical protein HBA_0255 [Sodalis endosymbiont of Henestaris halophilus]|nr:hypothetical protein HBA_0255 [Sodalis endosymbiont of Henestaris halophilus]
MTSSICKMVICFLYPGITQLEITVFKSKLTYLLP